MFGFRLILLSEDLAQIARLLITSNADPDVKDADGWTPLHHASRDEENREIKPGQDSVMLSDCPRDSGE